MFGKAKPGAGKGALADRVQQVTQRDARPAFAAPAVSRGPAHSSGQRAERQALYKRAALVFDDGQRMQVAVKNLSLTGARIEYFTKTQLPDHVLLVEPTLGIRRHARVAWQDEDVAGLEFIGV